MRMVHTIVHNFISKNYKKDICYYWYDNNAIYILHGKIVLPKLLSMLSTVSAESKRHVSESKTDR